MSSHWAQELVFIYVLQERRRQSPSSAPRAPVRLGGGGEGLGQGPHSRARQTARGPAEALTVEGWPGDGVQPATTCCHPRLLLGLPARLTGAQGLCQQAGWPLSWQLRDSSGHGQGKGRRHPARRRPATPKANTERRGAPCRQRGARHPAWLPPLVLAPAVGQCAGRVSTP